MMILKKLKGSQFFVVVITATLLSACGLTQPPETTKDTNVDLSQSQDATTQNVVLAEPNLTPKQRMAKAVRSLENGASDIAEAELAEYQKAVPNSRRAAILLKQLRTPSADYYPKEFFTLTLRSGQSLSTLAKKYLGTAWEFYALAKYNQISNPSRVNIGSNIKIPLTQLAKRVKEQDEQEAKVAHERMLSEQATASVEDEALDIDEPSLIEQDDAITELTPSELLVKTEEAIALSSFEDASRFMTELTSRNNLSTDIQSQAKQLKVASLRLEAQASKQNDPAKAATLYSQLGSIQAELGQELDAFTSFSAAIEADSTNTNAQQQHSKLQAQISEKYHREASVSFRKQELDDAIAKWDVVLQVDPDHSNALAYRSQAVDLKKRLEALNN